MTTRTELPPGCKAYTVTRSIHGEIISLTIIAPSATVASRLADEVAAKRREVQ